MPEPELEPTPIPALMTCEVTATGWVVLSGAKIGEGDGVGRREMLGEAEGVCVWERVSEGVPGVLDALVGSVREERGARASWRERLRIISDFILIGRAEPWSL
jgi:hypothetical protein